MTTLYSRTDFVEVTDPDIALSIPFAYLETAHLSFVVRTDPQDAETETPYVGTAVFHTEGFVTLGDAQIGTFVQIQRRTPPEPLVEFLKGNNPRSSDLNLLSNGIYFVLEELVDLAGGSLKLELPEVGLTYEIALSASLAFADAGPLVVGRGATIPINGGVYRASVLNPPAADQTVELRKNGNAVATIVIDTQGAVTVTNPSPIPLVMGDSLSLHTTSAITPTTARYIGLTFITELD